MTCVSPKVLTMLGQYTKCQLNEHAVCVSLI